MFRQLNWKLPMSYRQENIKNILSCDWQIYIACNNCSWEERSDVSFGVPSESILNSSCRICGHKSKYIIRHLIKAECLCQECSHWFEQYNISSLNELACPNCTSRKLSLMGFMILPEFPEKFGEFLSNKKEDWGISGADDGQYIIDSLKFTNILPDRELYLLPAIRLCERLRWSSKYPSDHDLGLIWNIEANLLRDYFKASNELGAGIDAYYAFQESINLTNEPVQKGLVIHNLAMICYSLLVKHPQDILSLNGAPEKLKEIGLQNAFEALNIFESGAGSNQQYSAIQVARIHHLIGDIYKIENCTDEDLELSINHLNKALQEKELPERLKAFIAESRSIAIAKMTNPTDSLKSQIKPGFEKVANRVENDRAYSEKWMTLLNIGLHYWYQQDYGKAIKSIEKAAAKSIYDLENILDDSTLELRSRQFVDVFKALLRCYVKFEKGLEALITLEKFRALTLQYRMSDPDSEILKKNASSIAKNYINQLLTGRIKHTTIEHLILPKKEFIKTLEFIEKNNKDTPIAFVSLSVFETTFSAILLIIQKNGYEIRTFQWEIKEKELNILSKNLPYLSNASIFHEKRMDFIGEIDTLFLLPELYKELTKAGIKKVGFSIQSIFNLFPFEAIKTPDTKLPLVTKFNIFYYPSLQVIQKLIPKEKSNKNKKMLIVPYQGKDLEFSTIELEELKRIGAENVTVFNGGQYPKRELLSKLEGDFDFIHFICHGTFEPLDPLKSCLILNEKPGESGKLYSNEILKVKFKNAPVISLSACSSGLTSFDKFETYSGLTGCFLQSGAKGILGSRWEIPDELGSKFMMKFYDLVFLKGLSVIDSVHETQMYLKNEINNKYWAAFSYLGIP